MTNTVYSVSQLTQALRNTLQKDWGLISVQGEITDIKKSAQQHWYFSLKDKNAQLRCVFFRMRNQFSPAVKEGQLVKVYANFDIYSARGDLQLTVESLTLVGSGQLYEAFLQLKDRLAAQGWFDERRKKNIPSFVHKIGLITSEHGAVLQDMRITLARHAPYIRAFLFSTPVQGVGADEKIAAQIAFANHQQKCQVLVLARGGGSMEDLATFNSELVAQAIHDSTIPIVSAVGHETDFTIADFVADLRAATPTAAIALVSKGQSYYHKKLYNALHTLAHKTRYSQQQTEQRLDYGLRTLRSLYRHDSAQKNITQQKLQQLRSLTKHVYGVRKMQLTQSQKNLSRLWQEYQRRVTSSAAYVSQQWTYLRLQQQQFLSRLRLEVGVYEGALTAFDMVKQLNSGYALVYDDQNKIVTHSAQIIAGARYRLQLSDGSVTVIGT